MLAPSLGSATFVLALLGLLGGAGTLMWGVSCWLTASWPPEVVPATSQGVRYLVYTDRKSGQETPVPWETPWSKVEFTYGGRQYTTDFSHPAFREPLIESGKQGNVWVFYRNPRRAIIAPGSWQRCAPRHAAWMRAWGFRWISLAVVLMMGAMPLAVIALLRINAVRRGARKPYALSLRYD